MTIAHTMKQIRLATQSDIETVTAIYDRIHGMEAEEKVRIGHHQPDTSSRVCVRTMGFSCGG